MNHKVTIDYYSDVLCVWAWIAQKRLDELNKNLVDKIEIRYHYMDIFGDSKEKMDLQWANKGHFNGFSEHVLEAAKPYPDAVISVDIWKKVKPTTSANVHLILKSIELQYGTKISADMAKVFRKSFFINLQDISNLNVLYQLADKNDLDSSLIKEFINNGKALALLMTDYQQAQKLSLKGSPTYIIDNGRQVLFGNVGYRVLLANIEEQLNRPISEASWC